MSGRVNKPGSLQSTAERMNDRKKEQICTAVFCAMCLRMISEWKQLMTIKFRKQQNNTPNWVKTSEFLRFQP